MNSLSDADDETTGRKQIPFNVIVSWASQIVVIVMGFILPRLIDHRIGTVSLGIWDLVWSLVSYARVATDNIGGSMSRFVARSVARQDVRALRRVFTTGLRLQLAVSVLLFVGFVILVYAIPYLFGQKLQANIRVTQLTLALIALSVLFESCVKPFVGVITGCQRWGTRSAIVALDSIFASTFMALAILVGGGLVAVAFSYMLVSLAVAIANVVMAYRVCPDLQIEGGGWQVATAKEMLMFDGKNSLTSLPVSLLIHTTRVLLVAASGASMLALFARPLALTSNIGTLVNKFTLILTPVAASLQGKGADNAQIGDFLIESVRYGTAITLPMLLFMAIFGDLIMLVWMGEKYVHLQLAIILALGYVLPMCQRPVVRVLMGLNMHGPTSITTFFIVLGGMFAGLAIVKHVGWTADNAALLIVIPLSINAVVIPAIACVRLKVPLTVYLRRAYAIPVFSAAVLAVALLGVRHLCEPFPPLLTLFVGAIVTAAIIVPIYWRWLLSPAIRQRLIEPAERLLQRLNIGDRLSS